MNTNNQSSLQITADLGHFANPENLPVDSVLAGFILAREDAQLLKHKFTSLTAREIEVLQHVAQGNANKQTAVELGISQKTVEKHREHLMQKLDIHHTAGLTRYAICVGALGNTLQRLIGRTPLAGVEF